MSTGVSTAASVSESSVSAVLTESKASRLTTCHRWDVEVSTHGTQLGTYALTNHVGEPVDIVEGHSLGADRVEHTKLSVGASLTPVMLAKSGRRAMTGERQNRELLFDSELKKRRA